MCGKLDGTLDIFEKYRSSISAVISERDDGIYEALNKGLALATGEVVAILHSDDFYADSTVICRVAAAFEREKPTACM